MKEIKEENKKQYPKDYLECCEVMYKNPVANYGKCIVKINDGYKGYEIQTLQKLIFCRDAYWKIAGEEMGLKGPWEPDWNDEKQDKYGFYNEVKYTIINSAIFVFPTAEMRDAFRENFGQDIEICKEFL